ncbi:MAG: hypothetical protein HEQ35_07900 [Gloeotrichia echinulata IR180]|nr:hypothetical protein [Gloeotrichia echinulata DEX184]
MPYRQASLVIIGTMGFQLKKYPIAFAEALALGINSSHRSNPDTYRFLVGARHCRALTNILVS